MSFSFITDSASSTVSSQVISLLMPQSLNTLQTASLRTPASLTSASMLALRSRTILNESGLSSGSNTSVMASRVPPSTKTHLTPLSFPPMSLISASFHDPVNSRNVSKKGPSLSDGKLEAAGTTTSESIRDGVSAPKTARKCSKVDFKVDVARLLTCSTSTAGSFSMLLPGFNSCRLGSAAATKQGATAHTNLRADGANTPFKARSCEASWLDGSCVGEVAGTHARPCNFSKAGARSPLSCAFFLFKYSSRIPARLKSFS
mmetsp:Transcript_93353/g.302092  ORF Transcript_93353/g.302092 Transcript_93353/m.302092 type:complete len:260 (+) Transcript_93353:10815-11594(+)